MIKYYKQIGVIGHMGMVGGTTFRYLKDSGANVFGTDLKDEKDKEKVMESGLIFVCVPTPFYWDEEGMGSEKARGFDLSFVDKALSDIPAGRAVVIKSTVEVGSTDKLQKKYPGLRLLFNPEFLSEKTCDADFRNPDRQFVGYTKQSYKDAIKVLGVLPESAYDAIMPAKEAELLKYINNVHGTIEIMESNMYWEVCQKEGLDYDRVLKAMLASKWVGVPMGRHYRVIFHKGKRGFGGTCFPKDINAWLQYMNKQGLDAGLPKAVRDMNQRILKEQKLSEADAEKIR